MIPIYDADEVDGVLYLAMRYVSGQSLQALLRERGRLSPEETLRIAEQIGSALDAAHRAGLVHRDVKPANILLAEPGDHAYLCDFGLAKRTSSKGVTRTGFFLGTVDYCAPEQIQGRPLDGRADVYSLGGVLFHCLAGQPPYTGETEFAVLHAHLTDPPPAVSSVRPDLPAALDEVLASAMAKDPDDRHPSASALVTASETHCCDTRRPGRYTVTQSRRTLVARRSRRLGGDVACCSPPCSPRPCLAGPSPPCSRRGDRTPKGLPQRAPNVRRPDRERPRAVGGGAARDRLLAQRRAQVLDYRPRCRAADRQRGR